MLNNRIIKSLTMAMVIIIIFTLVGCKKDEDENSATTTTIVEDVSQTTQEVDEQNRITTQIESTEAQEQTETQDADESEIGDGGNENNNSSTTKIYEYNVLVSEGTYYYNNAPITLEELIAEIAEAAGDKHVIITDNNATRNAYKALTDKLAELEIAFEEK